MTPSNQHRGQEPCRVTNDPTHYCCSSKSIATWSIIGCGANIVVAPVPNRNRKPIDLGSENAATREMTPPSRVGATDIPPKLGPDSIIKFFRVSWQNCCKTQDDTCSRTALNTKCHHAPTEDLKQDIISHPLGRFDFRSWLSRQRAAANAELLVDGKISPGSCRRVQFVCVCSVPILLDWGMTVYEYL